MRELESGDRVGNILAGNANNNAQLLNVAVDENIGNQANNNDHGDVSDVMERVLVKAAVENIVGYQNNDHCRLPRPLPVAREEVGGVQELESFDPVGNILAENADNNALLLDVAVNENIGP